MWESHVPRRQQRVRFSQNELVSANSTQTVNTENVWYTSTEIKSFKYDARMLSNAIRIVKMRRKKVFSTAEKFIRTSIAPSKTLCTRGLEQRIDLTRLARRKLAIREVIQAQNDLTYKTFSEKECYLAFISNKSSFSAKCEALLEGSIDAEARF